MAAYFPATASPERFSNCGGPYSPSVIHYLGSASGRIPTPAREDAFLKELPRFAGMGTPAKHLRQMQASVSGSVFLNAVPRYKSVTGNTGRTLLKSFSVGLG